MNNSTTFKHPHLQSFLNRYPTYKKLLAHAAFPLALTPELLYCLRENFVPDAPWIAVSDILLFLCEPVGFQLYEMSPDVRNELLYYLKPEELHKLSDFMVAYIRQQLKTNYRADEDLGAAPHWTALAYIKPNDVVKEIEDKIQELLAKKDPRKLIKFSSILETYADIDPLIKAGLEPLLRLARGEVEQEVKAESLIEAGLQSRLSVARREVKQEVNVDSLIEEMLALRRMNYRPLRNLLAEEKWKEADDETDRVMLAVAKRTKEGWLRVEDIDNFPCEDLRIIDQLWVKYSNGYFGFSVQKEIYQRLGGTRKYDRTIWEKFGDTVGWRKRGQWLYYQDITFSKQAPKAHLPQKSRAKRLQFWGEWGVEVLFFRVETCGL